MKILVTFKKKNKSKSNLLTLITNKRVFRDIEIVTKNKSKTKLMKRSKKIEKKTQLKAFKQQLIKSSRIRPKKESKTSYKIEIVE
jgi:hypothetical protein